jgi:hypothetical protein
LEDSTVVLSVAIYLLLAIVIISIPTYIRIRTSKAYNQKECQVAIRKPGDHILSDPVCLCEQGAEDLPFALLSQAAYQRKSDAKAPPPNSLNADVELGKRGWVKWPDFTDLNLRKKIKKVHLRVEVWEHEHDKKVTVAFGGTVFTNWKDWSANLRWFIPAHDDQYSVIVKTFGDAFVELYKKRTADWPQEGISICSTGHSLGGGLAQQFAYALPIKYGVPTTQNIPRVTKVYAFDPSPVTGYYSVGRRRRNANSKDLKIDRVYERREILAYLRSIMNFIYPPSAKNPSIRQLRYNLFPTRNPFAGHSISDFAYCLDQQLKKLKQPNPNQPSRQILQTAQTTTSP